MDVARLDGWAGTWAIRNCAIPRTPSRWSGAQRERNERWAHISAQVAAIEADALAIADRFGRGELTLARYDAITGPLDKRLAVLRAELEARGHGAARATRLAFSLRAKAERFAWLVRWDEGDPVERRAIVKMALRGRRIVVGPGKSARVRTVYPSAMAKGRAIQAGLPSGCHSSYASGHGRLGCAPRESMPVAL